MRLSEVVSKVITLSGTVYDNYSRELRKWHPNYPLVRPEDGNPPSPPEQAELRTFLISLPEDTIFQLYLIMRLGVGDYRIEDLAAKFAALKEVIKEPKELASRMALKASLAGYLTFGLEALRKHKIDVDKMPLKQKKVPPKKLRLGNS